MASYSSTGAVYGAVAFQAVAAAAAEAAAADAGASSCPQYTPCYCDARNVLAMQAHSVYGDSGNMLTMQCNLFFFDVCTTNTLRYHTHTRAHIRVHMRTHPAAKQAGPMVS